MFTCIYVSMWMANLKDYWKRSIPCTSIPVAFVIFTESQTVFDSFIKCFEYIKRQNADTVKPLEYIFSSLWSIAGFTTRKQQPLTVIKVVLFYMREFMIYWFFVVYYVVLFKKLLLFQK